MWLQHLSQRFVNRPRTVRRARPQAERRRDVRIGLEQLEDRTVPSAFNAATVSDLIADINAANLAGGSNTITLIAKTYNLTAVDNTTDGATGLPVIAAYDNLTILGNGDSIARSSSGRTPAFRLFDVASGASLALANLTLQGGLAFGSGVSAEGGAIYNQGTLDLTGVTVQKNVAQGADGVTGVAGGSAAGGGIYSSGSLTLQGGTNLQNNQAVGGDGGQGYFHVGLIGGVKIIRAGNGGDGLGGGLFLNGGSAMLSDVTVASNVARGGAGGNFPFSNTGFVFLYQGNGGNGFGGGIYASGDTMALLQTTATGNTAQGGAAGSYKTYHGVDGLGEGGGLYIDASATVSLDSTTVANVAHNNASTSNNDILGSYILTS
jgi:hypothetical protein